MVNNQARLDRVFRALSSAPRRILLQRIAERRANVQSLAKPLQMSLPAVSKHLKVLERAKLIRRTKVSRCYYFEISLKELEQAEKWIEMYTKFWKQKLASLETYIRSHSIS